MQLKPQSDYFLCQKTIQDEQQVCKNGLFYVQQNLPEYEIVEMSIALKLKSQFHVGDRVMSNAVPTKVKISDNVYFLIKEENVIGKI